MYSSMLSYKWCSGMSLQRLNVLNGIVVTFIQYFDFVGRALEYNNPQYKDYAAKHRCFPKAMEKLKNIAVTMESMEGEKLLSAAIEFYSFLESAIERHLKAMISYYETREWWLLRDRNTGHDGEVSHERFYKPAAKLFWIWYRGYIDGKYVSAETLYENIYMKTKDVKIGDELLTAMPTQFIIYFIRRRLQDRKISMTLVTSYTEKQKNKILGGGDGGKVIIPPKLPLYKGCIPIGTITAEQAANYNVTTHTSFNVLYDLDPLISTEFINENSLAVGQYSGVNKRIIRRYKVSYAPATNSEANDAHPSNPTLSLRCEKQGDLYRPLRRYDDSVCILSEPSIRTQLYNSIAEQKIFEKMIESHPRELVHTYEARMGGPSTGGIADKYTSRLSEFAAKQITEISHIDDLITTLETFIKPLSEELKKMLIEVYMPKPHHLMEFLVAFGVNLENMLLKFQREYRYCVAELISSGKLKEEILIPLTIAQRKKYTAGIVADLIKATEIILTTPPSALENFDVSLKRTSAQMLRLTL